MGLIVAFTLGNPFQAYNSKATKYLLQYSIVGLGFGMNAYAAAKAGQVGVMFTFASIAFTLGMGLMLYKTLKLEQKSSVLISSGTAICGGSAIAAVSPIIKADQAQISVALITVFVLNAVALFAFPAIGHYFDMSQTDFGLWAAIAIHDTSSVVGATAKYGEEALQVATTVKLQRALWIIPISLLFAYVFKNKDQKISFPYFILFFIAAMLISTFVPGFAAFGKDIAMVAKKGLTLTLFFIGAGLSRSAIQQVGAMPMLLGVLLWIAISVLSFMVIASPML
jgi:uncharacterized integral membrane protein (TIGR00698 family)